jgi:SAM-dependent MidA family methyltransferase
VLVERIRRFGPVRFDEFVDTALYGEDGFFATGRGAGRRADFLTSPELGPLFGAVLARAIDAEWERLGRPDPFVVVEGGAGRGALARSVLDAGPSCLSALRYVCVERSPALRDRAAERLPVEPPANVFGPAGGGDPDAGSPFVPGEGPVVTVLSDLPALTVTGVVVANELLDNLPFRLFHRRTDNWAEVLVGVGGDGQLVEVLASAPPDAEAEARRLAPGAPAGARIPLQASATAWLRRAMALLERGRVVVVDFASTTPAMAARPWREWVRTYRLHGPGGSPLDDPGTQDVTCEVAVDQLAARLGPPASDQAQADWLRRHGVEQLVDAARAGWRERAHVGDLAALAARSRVGEGEALCDPTGLGAFRVLEWETGAEA